jgi:hypothetical protein
MRTTVVIPMTTIPRHSMRMKNGYLIAKLDMAADLLTLVAKATFWVAR